MGRAGVSGGLQATALALAVLVLTETTQRTPVPSFGLESFERICSKIPGGRVEKGATIYDHVNEVLLFWLGRGTCPRGRYIRSDVWNRAKERKIQEAYKTIIRSVDPNV